MLIPVNKYIVFGDRVYDTPLPLGFYFWVQTWDDLEGPYYSVFEAKANLLEFIEWLNQNAKHKVQTQKT
jgi:hypothetical protein